MERAASGRESGSARGFILQASYRIRGGVPVVHLYGLLEGGGTFLVRDRRQTPHFHIRRRDAAHALRLGALRQFETARRTFDSGGRAGDGTGDGGERAVRVEVGVPQDAPPLRERLEAAGIPTFEADVRFAVRYLIDRGIQGGCAIDGAWTAADGIDRVYDEPVLRPATVDARPAVLSFDIETDPAAASLLAIALHGGRGALDEVYVVDAADRPMPPRAIRCATEREAIERFQARVREDDPDVLTGWNVIDFDLAVLARIAKRERLPLALGRDAGHAAETLRVRPARGYFGSGQASIPGRLVLDGMDLVRGAFLRFDDYSLDSVAAAVLGERKVDLGAAPEANDAGRAGRIEARFRDDLPTFVEYARADARLAAGIVAKLDLVALAVERSRLTGMTPDRVGASIASFDFLYLSALRRRRIVAPSVRSGDADVSRRQAGGHVFEPAAGMHENVWVFDFKSLYPSIIRTFNIDPLGYLPNALPESIALEANAHFRRGAAILPMLLDDLFPRRDAAKRAGNAVAAQALKILMNSFYGVLGTPACRFHNVAIANAITGMGRRLLQWSKAWFERQGFDVLYGDTDSVFVASGMATGAARDAAPELADGLNRALGGHIARVWNVASRLEMEFEKLYAKLFLPSMRHGAGGARKRYAGLIDGADAVEFVGMEAVRRDWTELAKDVQRELYRRLFAGEPVEPYLAGIAARLRGGELDAKLVYRKGLRKGAAGYKANTPPHVAAARKSANPGRVVAYLITVAGPEPLDALTSPPDREHYLDKQVRPVAEPVLAALDLDFDRVIGDDRQQTLF